MAKIKSLYICQECGYQSAKWLGRCPTCKQYNTMQEEVVEKTNSLKKPPAAKVYSLDSPEGSEEGRMSTGISELDRVLNGGIVEGSLALVGGDPGIGKSTLLLQICQNIGESGRKVLYVSGEESVRQIRIRATRLKVKSPNIFLLAETSMDIVEETIRELRPNLVIMDSIQTVYSESLPSAPGSVTQVRESASILMRLGKGLDISIIIVGHVTKDGALAGPRVLEHMVDTVLYFEGERRESYRIIRAVKNRFGGTNEIAVFEMGDMGLKEILNPSEYMLAGRPLGAPGSVVTCSMEGSRPLLAEVQALVSYTSFGNPRRVSTGIDFNRMVMLMAVLEKRAGLKLSQYDSYVNLAGGIRIAEPALDGAVIAAVASSFRNKPVDPQTIIFGEVGLTGEVRAVNSAEKRVLEAKKLGFTQCVLPQANLEGLRKPEGFRVLGAANINELLESVMGR